MVCTIEAQQHPHTHTHTAGSRSHPLSPLNSVAPPISMVITSLPSCKCLSPYVAFLQTIVQLSLILNLNGICYRHTFCVFDFSLVFNSMLGRVIPIAGCSSSSLIALHMGFHRVNIYEWTTHAILKQHLRGSCYGILYIMLLRTLCTFSRSQWCTGKYLTTGSPGRKALICSIWLFPWCKYFHHGWFQAVSVKSLSVALGRDMHGELSPAGASWFQHIAIWRICASLCFGWIPRSELLSRVYI